MSNFFSDIPKVRFEGKHTSNPFSYRYYNPSQKVGTKTMAEHLRIAVCYWHTFCWQGLDMFGENTFAHPWLHSEPMQQAKMKLDAAFEFFTKLDVPFFTFHDRDVAPEASSLRETQKNLQTMIDLVAQKMQDTGVKLLWGTANLFSHKRYLAGAATNPNPDVFCYAAAQVKQAMDATHDLKGENYVLWGGREGYDTLLNTDLKQEQSQLARFLHLIVDYKYKLGFKGTLLIEPKPCEPTKHQYDYDTATVYAFLQRHGLEKEFKVNIEANHATLAGHSFPHEVAYAITNDLFGSIDANQGDPQLGWDTDQFPTNLKDYVHVMYLILQKGGFSSGGFNFDTKLRRQSVELADLFYGHIGGIDSLAKALLIAHDLQIKQTLEAPLQQRYHAWHSKDAQKVLAGEWDLSQLAARAAESATLLTPVSGKQEYFENLFHYALDLS